MVVQLQWLIVQIIEFSEVNLAIALSNGNTSDETIRLMNHFLYLLKYLSDEELDAKTILIEENYISKDFLHN